MSRVLSGFFWISLYLLVVLAPIFLMLVPPTPSGRGFWLELSVALGFVGLTQIAVQFVLIARFKRLTAPYGIDVVLRYHKQIALVAVGMILAHPIILVIDNPSRAKLLNPFSGNWASRAAIASVLSLVLIVVLSVFRKQLRIPYEWWRLSHLILGVLAIVLAQLHVSLAGLYTNTIWKQTIWIAIAVLMVGLVLYLRVVKPGLQRRFTWRVTDVKPERGQTVALVLEPDGHEGMRFMPGQFAWIKLEGTPYTLEEHPFSFSSSAEAPNRIAFGIKALGDFSSSVADVKIGTRACLDGPHGAFSIDRYPATGFVFIAAGVGITPMMSFLHTMADRGDPRPVLLLYADKTWDDVAFRDEIDELKHRVDLTVVYVLQEPPDNWHGETGVIDEDLLRRRLPTERFTRQFFICGPPAMMTAVNAALLSLGVHEASIEMEQFDLA